MGGGGGGGGGGGMEVWDGGGAPHLCLGPVGVASLDRVQSLVNTWEEGQVTSVRCQMSGVRCQMIRC